MDEVIDVCFFSQPKVPDVPDPPSELGAAVTARQRMRQRQKSIMTSGREATSVTGPAGVSTAGTAKKTLLGQ